MEIVPLERRRCIAFISSISCAISSSFHLSASSILNVFLPLTVRSNAYFSCCCILAICCSISDASSCSLSPSSSVHQTKSEWIG